MTFSTHHAVSALLAYLLVGAVIWMLMFSAGVITDTWRKRVSDGDRNARVGVVLASFGVILGWPVIAWVFFAGVAQSIKGLRR